MLCLLPIGFRVAGGNWTDVPNKVNNNEWEEPDCECSIFTDLVEHVADQLGMHRDTLKKDAWEASCLRQVQTAGSPKAAASQARARFLSS